MVGIIKRCGRKDVIIVLQPRYTFVTLGKSHNQVRTLKKFLTITSLCISFIVAAPVKAEKVHQFIAMAFDGSKSLEMWQQTLDFAKANDIHFTYFISGPMFLRDDMAGYYKGPGHSRGRSDIGFGGTAEEIAARVAFVRRAYKEGHDIASHANGHWKGSGWTKEQWLDELGQFQDIMMNVHEINGIPNKNSREWRKVVNSITGFRAPLLAWNSEMLDALAELGYTYDTSRTNFRDYWPDREGAGIWNFPLASLPLNSGSVLSMDYNFFVLHNATGADPQSSMERAYNAYFQHNYEGSRAPIDIGHHFSRWKGGAYWRAMQNFALEYCGAKAVICGSYAELEDRMIRIRKQY